MQLVKIILIMKILMPHQPSSVAAGCKQWARMSGGSLYIGCRREGPKERIVVIINLIALLVSDNRSTLQSYIRMFQS